MFERLRNRLRADPARLALKRSRPDAPRVGVLFVCRANLCRSPMAAAVLRHHHVQYSRQSQESSGASIGALRLHVESAGTHAPRPAMRLDPRAARALTAKGYTPDNGKSRDVVAADFARFELVVAMDEEVLQWLERECPLAQAGKLKLFSEFVPGLQGGDVPDPYFGDRAGFDHVLSLCEAGAQGILRALAAGKLANENR